MVFQKFKIFLLYRHKTESVVRQFLYLSGLSTNILKKIMGLLYYFTLIRPHSVTFKGSQVLKIN